LNVAYQLRSSFISWRDDPFHRGFEYVPTNEAYAFAPINELWQ